MPVLDEVADYLALSSTRFAVGQTSTAIPIFLHRMPPDDTPEAIGLYESGGPAPMYTMNGLSYERPTVQVISRSTAYARARDNAEHVFSILSAVEGLDIAKSTSTGVTAYLSIAPIQSPFDMGRDAERRPMISCNYQVQKEIS